MSDYEIIDENDAFIYYKVVYDCKIYFIKHCKSNKDEYNNIMINEINNVNLLKGLNVSNIIDYNLDLKYIIFEYINGVSLDSYVFKNIKEKFNIIFKILDALSLIHERGIIHCDLKPSNIMISNNNVYIIDFGISCTKGKNVFEDFGSVEYSSPEQFRRQGVSIQTDIYSFGIILYELFVGVRPFVSQKNDVIEIMNMHLHSSYIIPSMLNNYIPKFIDSIIDKCLKKNPKDRYSSVDELKKDLYEKLYLDNN